MKKILLVITLISLFSTLAFAESGAVRVELQTFQQNFINGDKVYLSADGFESNARILAVLVDTYNEDARYSEPKILDEYDLQIDEFGSLSGYVVIDKIDVYDIRGSISVFVENAETYPTDMVELSGNLDEISNLPIESTSFDFTEASGNNIVALGELLTISASSSDWNTPLAARRYEYDGFGGTETTHLNISVGSLGVSGGALTGSTNNSNTAYDAATETMKLWILDDDFESAFSTTEYSVIDNIAPDLTNAKATSLSVIQVVFDEAVSAEGSVENNFVLSGADAGGLTVSSVAAVGSQPTTTWNLTLSGNLSNRSVGTVNIAYASNDTDSLYDVAGNQVANTSPAIAVDDEIAPATPTLTNPTTSTLLTGANVTLTASADDGATDPSIDGVRFQGRSNGGGWIDIGSDTNTGDGTYSFVYDLSTKYTDYRAQAYDGTITAESSEVGSFTDAHMIAYSVEPGTLAVGVRGKFTAQIQDNYGDGVIFSDNFNLAFNLTTSQASTGSFYDAASGGTEISQIVIAKSTNSEDFWYVDSDDNSDPTITATEPGGNLDVSSVNTDVHISSVPVDHFRIVLVAEADVTAGTAFSVTVTAQDASNVTVTGYVGDHPLNWSSSNAPDSPDGTSAQLPATQNYTFTDGVTTVGSIVFYNSNSGLTQYLRATDTENSINTIAEDAGASITVDDASTYEVVIKTAADAAEEEYANNVYGATAFQGPTQADPDKSTNFFGVVYDIYGNLVTAAESMTWSKDAALLGTLTPGGASASMTFDDGAGTGTTYTGTVKCTTSATYGTVNTSTGTIEVDDFAPAKPTVLIAQETTPVSANVDILWFTNSGDDGTSGTVTDYDIRFSTSVIDDLTKYNAAQSVGTSGKPLYSTGGWTVDMSAHGPGTFYFAMRTQDDVGNLSPLVYDATGDQALPVELSSFTAVATYGKVALKWETASELENEGFYLERALVEDGQYSRLNVELIPGQGSTTNATQYEFIDTDVVENTTYFYKLYSKDVSGAIHLTGGVVSATVPVLPKEFTLAQNYPNPFNPSTTIKFAAAKEGVVSLQIYNMLGQKVRTLINNEFIQPGVYDGIVWDATDDAGNQVANGIYYMEFRSKDHGFRNVKKIVFMK